MSQLSSVAGITPATTQPAVPDSQRGRSVDPRRRNQQGGLFRVLIGYHFDDGPPGCDCLECATSGGKNHIYRARRFTPGGHRAQDGTYEHPADPPEYTGDLIRTNQDLCARFNQGSFSQKFERVFEGQLNAPFSPDPQTAILAAENERQQKLIAELEAKLAAKGSPAPPATPTPPAGKGTKLLPDFGKMSDKELRDHAAAEEIDISKAKDRGQIIHLLKQSSAG